MRSKGPRCLLKVDSELKSPYQFFSLSLSLSHTHTHTHSLSLLCRTNFPHWAEKIAVSQAPHPSCSTLRIIKKRQCAGLQIHWLKQGLTTLGESDFRTTCGVSQWPRVFHSGSGFWLPTPALPTPRSCNDSFLWVLIHGQPLLFVPVWSLLKSCEQLYNMVLSLSSLINKESEAQTV